MCVHYNTLDLVQPKKKKSIRFRLRLAWLKELAYFTIQLFFYYYS